MNRSKLFGLINKGEWLELYYSHISVLQENEKEKAEVLEKKANAMKTLSELGIYTQDDLKQIVYNQPTTKNRKFVILLVLAHLKSALFLFLPQIRMK